VIVEPESFLTIFQIVVLTIALIGSIRIIGAGRKSLFAVMFAFATSCLVLSDLYWLTYEILRPDTRKPFAANEVGEWAMFLLFAAALTSEHPMRLQDARTEILFTCLFVIANVALWIGWSGEWVEDILTGLALGYFLCALALHIKAEGAFSDAVLRALGISSLVLVIAQALIFFVSRPADAWLDYGCYVLMFAVSVLLVVKAVSSLLSAQSPSRCICTTFAAFAWLIITMYMSSGAFYIAAVMLNTLSYLLMYIAIKRKVASE